MVKAQTLGILEAPKQFSVFFQSHRHRQLILLISTQNPGLSGENQKEQSLYLLGMYCATVIFIDKKREVNTEERNPLISKYVLLR